jgi:hypothetical protein
LRAFLSIPNIQIQFSIFQLKEQLCLLENINMDQQKTVTNPQRKHPLPPWKYDHTPYEYGSSSDSEKPKRLSHKKWVLIIILLLIISNSVTAAYFLNQKSKYAGQQQDVSVDSSSTPDDLNKQTGSRTIQTTPNTSSPISGGLPDYSSALSQANDTKRKADLTSIGTAINIYYAEFDLPEGFPTKKQCIGTSEGCYDLASLLVPEYIQKIPVDPAIGTQVNTGYSVYFDNQSGFVLEASGENESVITIYR